MKKLRKYLLVAGLLAFAPIAVSCGGDDPDEPEVPTLPGDNGGTTPGGGGTTTPADPTATYQVKSGIVHRRGSAKEYHLDGTIASLYDWDDCGPCIYEDFYVKYVLVFGYDRAFGIAAFQRDGSYWGYRFSTYSDSFHGSYDYFAVIQSNGKTTNIKDITRIADLSANNPGWYQSGCPKVSPDTGYYGSFRITDTDEVRHIRILVTGYTLDEYDQLASVNIQYQLYD